MLAAIKKYFRYPLEAAVAIILLSAFAILPFPYASWIGGAIFRIVGPWLKVHKRAHYQMNLALPSLSSKEIEENLKSMWWNLGRVAGEFPGVPKLHGDIGNKYVEILGKENIALANADTNGAIFFTGHIGNWEIAGNTLANNGSNLAAVYRAANNPIVDRIIRRIRSKVIHLLLPKGRPGAKGIIRHLSTGGQICMLIDQKMNDGISLPFFGQNAMTAPALAELALKYNCSVWPVRVERLYKTKYKITIYPRLIFDLSGDHEQDVANIMLKANRILENWISERPEQWLWPHRRWPNK